MPRGSELQARAHTLTHARTRAQLSDSLDRLLALGILRTATPTTAATAATTAATSGAGDGAEIPSSAGAAADDVVTDAKEAAGFARAAGADSSAAGTGGAGTAGEKAALVVSIDWGRVRPPGKAA